MKSLRKKNIGETKCLSSTFSQKLISLKIIFLAMILCAVMTSCKKDEEAKPTDDESLSADIEKLVPEELLNEIIKLGMPINKGKTPPVIQGSFKAAPYVLKNSNISTDNIGKQFSSYKFKLYDQNSQDLKIKLDYINGPEDGKGLGGFISGQDNSFTVFAEVEGISNGTTAKLVHIISGNIESGGIKNFYFANFMIDNKDNAKGYWIEDGEGRVIYDSDGFSEKITNIELGALKEDGGSLRKAPDGKGSGQK